MVGSRTYKVTSANPGYDPSSREWIEGVPWRIMAPVVFPQGTDFDRGLVSVALYFSMACQAQESVVLLRSFMVDGQDDNTTNLPLELLLGNFAPDILHRAHIDAFPLNRGEGGAYIVACDITSLDDTAASEDAVQLWALEFTVSNAEASRVEEGQNE